MIDMFDLMTTASVAATFVRASSGASAPTSHPCSSSGNCLRSHLAAHPGQRPDGRRPPRQGHARPRPRRPADAHLRALVRSEGEVRVAALLEDETSTGNCPTRCGGTRSPVPAPAASRIPGPGSSCSPPTSTPCRRTSTTRSSRRIPTSPLPPRPTAGSPRAGERPGCRTPSTGRSGTSRPPPADVALARLAPVRQAPGQAIVPGPDGDAGVRRRCGRAGKPPVLDEALALLPVLADRASDNVGGDIAANQGRQLGILMGMTHHRADPARWCATRPPSSPLTEARQRAPE